MAAPRKFKYNLHLAKQSVATRSDFLNSDALSSCTKISLRGALRFPCDLYVKTKHPATPAWARSLNRFFTIDGYLTTSSASGVLVFEARGRIFASTYGHGHTLIEMQKRENDFGLIVAANAISENNVKQVEKANLGTVLRDLTQASGNTQFTDFGANRALSLIRRLTGQNQKSDSAVSGASALKYTTRYDIDELDKAAVEALNFYNSPAYKKTSFAIIDKIKPVYDAATHGILDAEMLKSINSQAPSFELGAPEVLTESISFLKISGAGVRTHYADITLADFVDAVSTVSSMDELHKYRIVAYDVSGTQVINRWSVYKGLIGSLDVGGTRYALNEGQWYEVDTALQSSANMDFNNAYVGLDTTYEPWPIVGMTAGKNPKKKYKVEYEYNTACCSDPNNGRYLFDQVMFPVPNTPGPGIEICDIFDANTCSLVHVKKSGRRSSVISHFLMQGLNSARLLKQYPQVKNEFFSILKSKLSDEEFKYVSERFPNDWKIRYMFGDKPMANSTNYTVPFFSRITFSDAKREIESLGYNAVEAGFIKLST